LITVNLVLVLGLATLLTLDYRGELEQRIDEKQSALLEEAITLLPAVLALRDGGPDAVQKHVDVVCGQMRETTSPGHHIAVRLGDTVVQAQAHHRASPELFATMEDASTRLQPRIDTAAGPIILARAHGSLIRRTVGLASLCVVGAVIVNVILVRLVTRPLGALVETVRRIGSGHLGVQAGRFNTAELDFLANEINAMSVSLANAEKDRSRQFEKARRLQRHLGPQSLEVPGLKFAHAYEPATHVTGDYFDLIPQRDETWLLCVADVCGHGVPAAMGAAVLKMLLLAACERTSEPTTIFSILNERFRLVTLPEDFATMILVHWDPRRSELRYASAGHETCFFFTQGGRTVDLVSTGPVLGVYQDCAWESRVMRAGDGDRLVLLTDGIADTINPRGECFGRERARSYVLERRTVSPDELAANLSRDLSAYRHGYAPRDDITILAARFGAHGRPGTPAGGPVSSTAVASGRLATAPATLPGRPT
jgi:sigma-B regulation protein RsbU (phosphoserine phosphatase)